MQVGMQVCIYIYICVSACLSACRPSCLSVSLSVLCLRLCLCLCLSVCMHAYVYPNCSILYSIICLLFSICYLIQSIVPCILFYSIRTMHKYVHLTPLSRSSYVQPYVNLGIYPRIYPFTVYLSLCLPSSYPIGQSIWPRTCIPIHVSLDQWCTQHPSSMHLSIHLSVCVHPPTHTSMIHPQKGKT